LLDQIFFGDFAIHVCCVTTGASLSLHMSHTKSALAFSIVGLEHEVVEDEVVFDRQDVNHVFKVELALVKCEQFRQLVLAIVEDFVEEAFEVELHDGLVLTEDLDLLRLVVLVVLRGEHEAEVVDKGLDRQEPLVALDEVNEEVKTVLV